VLAAVSSSPSLFVSEQSRHSRSPFFLPSRVGCERNGQENGIPTLEVLTAAFRITAPPILSRGQLASPPVEHPGQPKGVCRALRALASRRAAWMLTQASVRDTGLKPARMFPGPSRLSGPSGPLLQRGCRRKAFSRGRHGHRRPPCVACVTQSTFSGWATVARWCKPAARKR
jgi:hypothetical protein